MHIGPAIIGWLNSGSEITPSNFTDNREFIQFMHKVIKDNLVLDPELGHMALLQKTGYMHIQDNRNPPYANRYGFFGWVVVRANSTSV